MIFVSRPTYILSTLLLVIMTLLSSRTTAQSQENEIEISGTVAGEDGILPGAHVVILNSNTGVTTSIKGGYQLTAPANASLTLQASYLGYETLRKPIRTEQSDMKVDFVLKIKLNTLDTLFQIVDESDRTSTMSRIDPKHTKLQLGASDHFEKILFNQPGVSSNNELSSQYSVRGGNFDENLVYVNGIQIYRPFLIRSGQQEGLSFINPDLVEGIEFSAGGFDAKYGDKMSSVLDITYKEPTETTAGVNMSMLGASAYFGDISKNYRFTQIHGFRYKTNRYILGSLDTDGAYQPTFFDYQTYLTYDLTDKLEMGFLGYVSSNQYQFIPQVRQTEFGTIAQALRLTVYFDGQESDQFNTYSGALQFKYKPNRHVDLNFYTSAFTTIESETFDILGQYWLDELERDLGDEDFGEVKFNRGIGSFLDHARNYLQANVVSARHVGEWRIGGDKYYKKLQWGTTAQHEHIQDQLREWSLIDSAGYSLPQPPGSAIILDEFAASAHTLNSYRISGFVQHDTEWRADSTGALWTWRGGIRSQYWTINDQVTVSPRTSISYEPAWDSTDIVFRFSWGVYHQPPFYRELRNLSGEINEQLKAQTSYHYVLGADYNFMMWDRPFKFVGELYFKQLYNLVPYEYDNVRIRYYAENNAKGDAKGIDLKINGEFVPGVESWASLSVMNIREDIRDDFYYLYTVQTEEGVVQSPFNNIGTVLDSSLKYPGYIPRPTDQRFNFGLFFQDYLPRWPSYKMNLNLLYGTGLPFGPPSYERYKDTLRIPPYRRVDIGFSKQLISADKPLPSKHPLRHVQSMWVSLEVFNLLQLSNTISYIWVKDVTNTQYAVPNFLTNRRINVRLVMDF